MGQRPRQWAALGVLAVAAVITAATSSLPPTLEASTEGDPFVLSPDAPERRVPLVFDANRAALTDRPTVQLDIAHSVFWQGEQPTDAPVQVRLIHQDGEPAHGDDSVHRSIDAGGCRGRDCTGEFELVFTWPSDLTDGSVRVQWGASAILTWQGEKPAEAEISLTAGESAGGAPAAPTVAAWSTYLLPEKALSIHEVAITTDAAVADGALTLGATYNPDAPLHVAATRGPAALTPLTTLDAAHEVTLELPQRCVTAPCRFTLATLLQATSPLETGAELDEVRWSLAAPDGVGAEVELDVKHPPVLSAASDVAVAFQPVGPATRTLEVRAEIPADALTPDAWLDGDGRPVPGPPVSVRLHLEADPDTAADADVCAVVELPGSTHVTYSGLACVRPDSPMWLSRAALEPCTIRRDCHLQARFELSPVDSEGYLGSNPSSAFMLTGTVEVAVMLPWTGVPAGTAAPVVTVDVQ